MEALQLMTEGTMNKVIWPAVAFTTTNWYWVGACATFVWAVYTSRVKEIRVEREMAKHTVNCQLRTWYQRSEYEPVQSTVFTNFWLALGWPVFLPVGLTVRVADSMMGYQGKAPESKCTCPLQAQKE